MEKWYALNQEGDMIYVGEFESFEEADEALEYGYVWLVDEEIVRKWKSQLAEMLA